MITDFQQLLVSTEAVEGTAKTVVAGDGEFQVSEIEVSDDNNKIDRNLARGHMTKAGQLTGFKARQINCMIEMHGMSAANKSTAPAWGKMLDACGFISGAVISIPAGSVTGGPFQSGEVVIQDVTLASGIIINAYAAAGTIYLFELGAGTWDSSGPFDDIVGQTSAATTTPTADDTAYGYGWRPGSFQAESHTIGAVSSGPIAEHEKLTGGTSGAIAYALSTITNGDADAFFRLGNAIAFTNGELVTAADSGATYTTSSAQAQYQIPAVTMQRMLDGRWHKARGCRGQMSLTMDAGDPLRMSYQFTGANDDNGDAALFDIDFTEIIPPLFDNATITIDSVSYDMNQLALNLENRLARKQAATYNGGLKAIRITGREWAGTMNVDSLPFGTKDWIDILEQDTKIVIDAKVGSSEGNRFWFVAPQVQIDSLSEGDSDGLATDEMPFRLTNSVKDGELFIVQY